MNKRRLFIVLLLVVVITIVIFNFTIGRVEEKKIETGKINIIDIKEEIKEDIIDNNPEVTEPVIKEEEIIEKIKDLIVYDKYTNFSSEHLKIFTDPYYEFREVIAPGSTNIYQFVVENNFDFDVIYKIEMVEDNIHNINMKYKLRRENDYLLGNDNAWIDAEDLVIDDKLLVANSKDNYYLEWIWEESPNDTSIGETINANYALSISVNVKRADEE